MIDDKASAEYETRPPFLLDQPLYLLMERDPLRRWQAVTSDADPSVQEDKGKGLEPAFRSPRTQTGHEGSFRWRRIKRDVLVDHLAAGDPFWRRVGLVCGAGLGKTANLQWLEAAINGLGHGRGRQLAWFRFLYGFPIDAHRVFEDLKIRINNKAHMEMAQHLARLLAAGRITFLLDSLDQAGPEPRGPVVAALNEFLRSFWKGSSVWISGRPYAFQLARELFGERPGEPKWRFVRVGQLGIAEARFLVETAGTRGPGSRRVRQNDEGPNSRNEQR